MNTYYNEWDTFAAAWTRELMKDGLIAQGEVDETDIQDVVPERLSGYRQWHLFAGISCWSAALRMAGWKDDREVFTVSCPCQPFSSAGKRAGIADERHLWPAAFHIISQLRPAVVFGEQVWSKDTVGPSGKRKPKRSAGVSIEEPDRPAWIDNVFNDLEAAGYSCWAVGFPAAGVGAPHIRQRLYFCGIRQRRTPIFPAVTAWPTPNRLGVTQGDSERKGLEGHPRNGDGGREPGRLNPAQDGHAAETGALDRLEHSQTAIGRRAGSSSDARRWTKKAGGSGSSCRLDNTERNGAARANAPEQSGDRQDNGLPRQASAGGRLGDPGCTGDERWGATGHLGCAPSEEQGEARQRERRGDANCDSGIDRRPGPVNGLWSRADWLFCRDGKWRPVESGTFPLADAGAFRNRVAELRGAGNALCIAQAAEFIGAVMDCLRAPHTDRSAA